MYSKSLFYFCNIYIMMPLKYYNLSVYTFYIIITKIYEEMIIHLIYSSFQNSYF